ncbi:MAG: hypoxanthine phosphoribosyltransferase [Acidobacteria bacterium]|nr:hypoxanthine phosphoribosyltransferase [Acidobacteriota bacterium]
MNNPTLRVMISDAEIDKRIHELGEKITEDYKDGDLVLVGILKGAFIFVADLARAINRPVRLDFMGISSYGKGKTTSGEVKVTKDLDASIEGANVIIVEDIVDTGVTLSYLIGQLHNRKPRSIRIAALLDKPDRRLRPVQVSYTGFTIPDEFVVGYGLDYAEDYRGLKDICILSDGAT